MLFNKEFHLSSSINAAKFRSIERMFKLVEMIQKLRDLHPLFYKQSEI